MVGKFDSPLVLASDGETLEVCGPIRWHAPTEEPAVRIEVRITQDGHELRADSAPRTFSPPDERWTLSMQRGPLQAGEAVGLARAFDGEGNLVFEWEESITIEAPGG